MKNDFVLIQRRPTPEELLKVLIQIVPDFGLHWNRSDNCFRNDDGTFSLHGVFAELSHYIRESFSSVKDPERVTLFEFIEKCVLVDPDSDSGVSNAACTCFLENVAGEGGLSAAIATYLGVNSKEYFDKWD